MAHESTLGAKIRVLRRRHRISQTELARRLGISSSYLNLIEHNRRSVPGDLLVRLTQVLPVDLRELSAADDDRAASELLEVFEDPLFEGSELIANDIRELSAISPGIARAVLHLYGAYRWARESSQHVSEHSDPYSSPTDEVTDFIQRHLNHFPALEAAAEQLWSDAKLTLEDLFVRLSAYLRRTRRVQVRIEPALGEILRVYDAKDRVLSLSETLSSSARGFQLAHQIALLTIGDVLDRLCTDPVLTSDESRALCRFALADYFAGCVLMPYAVFAKTAKAERHDLDVLGNRFRVSFEQLCHRLTTLQRPGAEGIPFHLVRVDIAGNVSKRFSASGLRFARFGGVCPRWNVFRTFLTPGMIRLQLCQHQDDRRYFEIGRTLTTEAGSFKEPRTQLAISIGCDIEYAPHITYADGLDLARLPPVLVEVGPTCRLCDRPNCQQRAQASARQPLVVNENVRGGSFYSGSVSSSPAFRKPDADVGRDR